MYKNYQTSQLSSWIILGQYCTNNESQFRTFTLCCSSSTTSSAFECSQICKTDNCNLPKPYSDKMVSALQFSQQLRRWFYLLPKWKQ
uniref:Uncharacterized protein n=1 Tax=Strigamia maritima TaxID=126957 RepID=T1J304_STRMM